MQAKLSRATLAIFIPYPPAVKAAVEAAQARTREIATAGSGIAATLYPEDIPAVSAFMESQPWDAIRAEMTRKAKKVDLGFHESLIPLTIRGRTTGLCIEASATAPRKEG